MNIRDMSYIYALNIFNIIKFDNKNNEFNRWKKFFNLLILFNKNKFLFKLYLINKKEYFKIIYFIIKKYINLDIYMNNFLKIILKNNILYYIKLIYFYFIKLYKKKYNILNIIIYSSYNINYKNIKLIKKIIRNSFIYKKIKFFFKLNKNLIAGFKIYINDYIIDSSLIKNIKKINFIFNKKF